MGKHQSQRTEVTFRTDNGELNAVPVVPDESGRIIVTTNELR